VQQASWARSGAVALALVAVVLAGAACGSSGAAGGPSSTTAATSAVSSTTTTTTTIPPPTYGIPGTSPLGSLQTLGSIQRVAVVPPAVGATAAATAAVGATPPPFETIAFRRFGAGPDLLLIAGEHATITSWDPKFVLDLASRFRVTLFDPPGVGYSGPGLTSPSVASYADAAAGLANALGLVTPVVVGWGLGGGVALSALERHRGLFSGAVLLNSTLGAPGEKVEPAAAAVLGSSLVTPVLLSRLYFPPSAEAARLAWLDRISDVSPDSIVTGAVRAEVTVERRGEQDTSLVAGEKDVTVPVLVLSSSTDAVAPPGAGKVIADALPQATYASIHGGGYASFSIAESEVVSAIGSLVSAALGN
jgi:pimeloyl-ACP methyl ester carboxylesterase